MPKGFYFPGRDESKDDQFLRPSEAKTEVLKINKGSCRTCGLYKKCETPRLGPTGENRLDILLVGEAQGQKEDEQGIQFVGKIGRFLRKTLRKMGYDLDEDFLKVNAVQCRPPKNATPSNSEIAACRSRLLKVITETKPKKIILLGAVAVQAFLGHRTKFDKITKWAGWTIPDQDVKAWVFPTYHPSYVLRNERNPVVKKMFKEHLKTALEWDKPFPDYGNEESKITKLMTADEATQYLKKLNNNYKGYAAFDYEATGLKPDYPGHEIVCVGISTDENEGVAFPYFQHNTKFVKEYRKFLTNPHIRKITQNQRMERDWSIVIAGIDPSPFVWDTMDTSHILDFRSGITGLKFQLYVRYGLLGYDKEIDPYKKSGDSKNANSFNKMKSAPIRRNLVYCGIDAMGTYRLAMDQMEEIEKDPHLRKGVRLFHNASLALNEIGRTGIKVNTEYCKEQAMVLTKEINRLKTKIDKTKEARKWYRIMKKKLNPTSQPQVTRLLYDIMKFPPNYKNEEEQTYALETEHLIKMGTPFTLAIADLRKTKNNRDYLDRFLRESVKGLMRPFINLNLARTYRSSYNSPSFQNIPKRDRASQKAIRTAIIPRPGRGILEADYSGVEVSTGCFYHKDQVMITYVSDKTTDMHRDTSMEIYLAKKDWITKDLRYSAKNEFVFPQFYGSYYKQCLPPLWLRVQREAFADGTPVREHLRSEGIKNITQFENHLRDVERSMWEDRFVGYHEWRQEAIPKYHKNGYIELLTGFRIRGILSRNEIWNYPFQGTAFHLLLWSATEVHKRLKEGKFNSFIIGQIHDSLVIDYDPDELKEVVEIVHRVMTKDIRHKFKWINIPLEIEVETSEIDSSWAEMEEIDIKRMNNPLYMNYLNTWIKAPQARAA